MRHESLEAVRQAVVERRVRAEIRATASPVPCSEVARTSFPPR